MSKATTPLTRAATPVGIFANGASPYGCLDMVGNVWEWTRSKYANDFGDAVQEETRPSNDGDWWVVRGGSWISSRDLAYCAIRFRYLPDDRYSNLGFRVVLRSSPVL